MADQKEDIKNAEKYVVSERTVSVTVNTYDEVCFVQKLEHQILADQRAFLLAIQGRANSMQLKMPFTNTIYM